MNADHAFFIGNTHTVCQDYAMSDVVEGGAYAILCDGCSSSPDVDFGARALAFSAKRTLTKGGTDFTPELFGQVTIDNLRDIGKMFTIHPQALDATLLVAWIKDKQFKVHMFGDGVFFHKTSTTLRIVHVDYEPNGEGKVCPAYLSYYLEDDRKRNYDNANKVSKHIRDVSLYLAGGDRDAIEVEDYIKPFDPVSFSGIVDNDDVIGICSDGINTFKKGDGTPIDWATQIREFIDFKTTTGVFVQRHLGFLTKKTWKKNLITHDDDISMATIIA